jgi:beta-phosphoglucomutase-like phosphatase (HAD superfamily)
MRKINALIFDVSGVLINDLPAVWLANRDAYSSYGYHMFSSIDEYKERFKLPIREFHRSNGIPEEMIDTIERKYREVNPLYQHLITLFPEVKNALSSLKNKGLKLGVASNIPSNFLKEHLFRFEILEYFDAIVGQDDCDEQKTIAKTNFSYIIKVK